MTGRYATFEYAKAPYVCVKGVSGPRMMLLLKNQNIVSIPDDRSLYALLGRPDLELELKSENLAQIENELKRKLNFYILKQNIRNERSLFHKVEGSYSEREDFAVLNFVVRGPKHFTDNTRITNFGIINMDISNKSTFFCTKCWDNYSREDNFKRHENDRCKPGTTVKAQHKAYGSPVDIERQLCDAGYIKEEHMGYITRSFAAYDIETTEEIQDDDTREKATLKLLSISYISRFDTEPQCFVRENDSQEACGRVVEQFLAAVDEGAKKFEAETPTIFAESLAAIKEIEKTRRAEQQRCRKEKIPYKLELFPTEWKMWLSAVTTFKCYSFNGSRFDLKVLGANLFSQKLASVANSRRKYLEVLRRGSSYFSFSYKVDGITTEFADICNFLSPCKLSDFLKMTNVDEQKSVFPYQHFSSITQLEEATTFPDYAAFWSDLKNEYSCSLEEYEAAKAEFNHRIALPHDDPKKMFNMKSWLIYYNNLDTKPLLKAITAWFDGFMEIFGVDGQKYSSLPSMAHRSMFKNFNPTSPYLHSLPKWETDLRNDFRQSIVAGLCSNPHRMIDLRNETDAPNAAIYAPNGDKYSSTIAYDFNSLYPWALKENMPCSPGIHWKQNDDGSFTKNQMLHDSSFQELQYIMYLQFHDDRFQNPLGGVYQIEHAYFRGQITIDGMQVDGYAECAEKKYIIEYNGCYHHRPCPNLGCKHHHGFKTDDLGTYAWYQKAEKLRNWCRENNGELILKWGCQMDYKSFMDLNTPYLPRILRKFEKKRDIIPMIKRQEIFGFIKCDLDTPPDVIEKFKHLNFPPITRRHIISHEMVSPYMQERLKECKRSADLPMVVNAWTGKQLMIYTPLLNLYMSLGIKISNVTKIIQYVPSKCFEQFIDKCVQGRIDASNISQTRANTFKVIKYILVYLNHFKTILLGLYE